MKEPRDGLEEAQAGIKIAGRNINNLRYADDATLMAESDSAPISFRLCFPISPSPFLLMFFLKPLSSVVERFLYTDI